MQINFKLRSLPAFQAIKAKKIQEKDTKKNPKRQALLPYTAAIIITQQIAIQKQKQYGERRKVSGETGHRFTYIVRK